MQFDTLFEKAKSMQFDTITKCQSAYLRVCKITGISLALETSESVYIKTTTLRYLKKHCREEYLRVKKELLPIGGKVPKFEREEVVHLAKQIRNRYYNPRKIKQEGYNRARARIPQAQLSLAI